MPLIPETTLQLPTDILHEPAGGRIDTQRLPGIDPDQASETPSSGHLTVESELEEGTPGQEMPPGLAPILIITLAGAAAATGPLVFAVGRHQDNPDVKKAGKTLISAEIAAAMFACAFTSSTGPSETSGVTIAPPTEETEATEEAVTPEASPTPEEILNAHGIVLEAEEGGVWAVGGPAEGGHLSFLSVEEIRTAIADILQGNHAVNSAGIPDGSRVTVFVNEDGLVPWVLPHAEEGTEVPAPRLYVFPSEIVHGGRTYRLTDPGTGRYEADPANSVQIVPALEMPRDETTGESWHSESGWALLRIETPTEGETQMEYRVLVFRIAEQGERNFLGSEEHGPEPIWEWIGPEIPLTVNIEGESFESSIQFAIGERTAFVGGDMIGPATQAGLETVHQPILDADLWSAEREAVFGDFIEGIEDGWAIPRIEEMMAIIYPHLRDLIGRDWQRMRFAFVDHNTHETPPAEIEYPLGYLQTPYNQFDQRMTYWIGLDRDGKVVIAVPASEEALAMESVTRATNLGVRRLMESGFISNRILDVFRGLNSNFWANNGDERPPNPIDGVRLSRLFNPIPNMHIHNIVAPVRREGEIVLEEVEGLEELEALSTEAFGNPGILILPSDSP